MERKSQRAMESEERESLTPGGVAVPPPIRVQSEEFSGSLATLFHLAREGRVDLTKVPLAPVCRAYIEYLNESAEPNLDAAGAALLALAYLVERKAWALIPIADPPPPEEIPELPEPTAHEYEEAVEELHRRFLERRSMFFRAVDESEDFEMPFDLGNVTPQHLANALQRVLDRAEPVEPPPVPRPLKPLRVVMQETLGYVREHPEGARFDQLLPSSYTVLDAVLVFLSVLELIRLGQLRVRLESDEILVYGSGEGSE